MACRSPNLLQQMPRAWKSIIQMVGAHETCEAVSHISPPFPSFLLWGNKEKKGPSPPDFSVLHPRQPPRDLSHGPSHIKEKDLIHLFLIGHLHFKGSLAQMCRVPGRFSMISYLLHAWEGMEGATHSPWAQGSYNLAVEKARPVHFVPIFSSRGRSPIFGMVMSMGSRSRETWVQIPAPPLSREETWC